MRALGRAAAIGAVLMVLAGMARAADIRVLSVETVQDAVRALAADFARESGHRIVLTVGSPAEVTQRLAAGEIHDVTIVAEPAMDTLDRDGIVNPESRLRLAKGDSTVFEGALMSDGAVPEAARAFVRFLASADARERWVAARLDPILDH